MSNATPYYDLTIDEEDLIDLQSDIWNDMPVPAYLKVENVHYDIDLSYRGSYTRKFPKKSYSIHFIEPNRFDGAREIHLNAEYKDPSIIRNKLSLDFFQNLGVLSPDSHHVNLRLNGSLKGVFLQLESVDDLFLAKRNLPPGPIYYAVNNNANFSFMRGKKSKKYILSGYQQKNGNWLDDVFLHEFIMKINRTPLNEFPDTIAQYLNIENYLRWLSGAVCTMNNDGFTHNYALYRNSLTGLFEIIPWDYDATWGRRVNGKVMSFDFVPLEGHRCNHLTFLLLQVPEFRKLYRELMEEILEEQFTVKNLEDEIISLHQALRPHLLFDPYKKKDIHIYDGEPDFIFQFIRERNDYLKNQLIHFE
ncbi:CotH kinase family protein [Neobacillus fumarioli]|uniref:CotH kinase family protein n=1 Tax=Neobacillus fumarioli TaxID=105229 RepID=UPI000836B9F7|nr:CotH kinase family protein [Neobacillus fumarioli]